jgi:hypothetical protein
MLNLKSSEFKILLIGILLGIILTFLTLKIINIPLMMEDLTMDEEGTSIYDEVDIYATDSADLEPF